MIYICTKKQTNKMAYVKVKDRNYKYKEVYIISKLGVHRKMVREDRVKRYISDYILFNNLIGTPYMVKE